VQCDEDFPLGAIKIDRVIGEGAFGRVHVARYGSATVAVKFLNDELDDPCNDSDDVSSARSVSCRDPDTSLLSSVSQLGSSEQPSAASFLQRMRSRMSTLPRRPKKCGGVSATPVAHQSPSSAFEHEISIMSDLSHPNIASYYGVGTGLERPALVMEYARRGSLADVVSSSTIESLDWSTRIDYMRQVACGLEYMHSRSDPVQHCDLRAENVLITSSNVAKICDFGLARVYSSVSLCELGEEPAANNAGRTCVRRKTTVISEGRSRERNISSMRGTAAYLAPEVVNERPGTPEQAEVYALGVLAWYVAHCKVDVALEAMADEDDNDVVGADESYFARAFARMFGRSTASHQFAQVVCFKEIEGYQLRVGSHVPAKLATAISLCTAEDPNKRPSFSQVVAMLSA